MESWRRGSGMRSWWRGLDAEPALEGLFDRASVGDVEESRPLLLGDRADQLDLALELTHTHRLGLAVDAVDRVRAHRPDPDDDVGEGPLLAVGVHPDGHRRARREGAE